MYYEKAMLIIYQREDNLEIQLGEVHLEEIHMEDHHSIHMLDHLDS
jgi:hypothetical protein